LTPVPPDGRPTLTVGIASLGERVFAVRPDRLPRLDGVRYLVVVQSPPRGAEAEAHVAALLARGDVELHEMEGCGLSRSRNAAMDRTSTDLLLLADDDVELRAEALTALRHAFAGDPALDFACLRLHAPGGEPYKRFGASGTPVRFWNCGKVGSPEVALRIAPIRAAQLRFDETFGAGTPAWFGEEYIFLLDARRAGLRGRHLDIVVGFHPPESSGVDASAAAMRVRRAVFRRALGWYWRPAFALFKIRNRLRAPRA
jgi:hypothetical protein